MPDDLFGNTIFCDDIRIEADGKLCLIGAYQSVLFTLVPFPVVLAKFCAYLNIYENKQVARVRTRDWNLLLTASWSEIPIWQHQMPAEQIVAAGSRDAPANPGLVEGDPLFISLHIPLVFSPFVLPASGVIRARLLDGDRSIRLGAMRIDPHPNPPVFPLQAQPPLQN